MESTNTQRKYPVGWLITSGAFFLHFLSLGFAVFPLQTHLRQVHSGPVASILASFIPIAGLLTFLLFGLAQRMHWTNQPGRLLLGAACAAGILQLLLGLQLDLALSGRNLLPTFIETAVCLLLLACAHACCMNLLNHLAVANLSNHAYSARAAGSIGYMIAILITGAFLSDETTVLRYHLFIAASCAAAHILFVGLSQYLADPQSEPKLSSHTSEGSTVSLDAKPNKAPPSSPWRWRALVSLVGITSYCEGAFGLYAHEFLTQNFGDLGYYLFASCILLETALLLSLPYFPGLRKHLLFVGPLGWLLLLAGCLITQSGFPVFGVLALAMSLNCPFQVSCNENSHAMQPKLTGLATIALAQTLGVFCSQWTSALVNRWFPPDEELMPWTILWTLSLGVASLGIALAIMIQRKIRHL